MSSERSKKVRWWKEQANEKHGHEMGNVVNCAPLPHMDVTVQTRCRKCGRAFFIMRNQETQSWGAENADGDCLFTDCPNRT